MKDSHRLTRSREDYLKALYALDGASHAVTVGELARRLCVSPPSATNMLDRLAREALVTRARRGEARLTGPGKRRALDTLRRHRLLETFLVSVLGLDWAEAHEDAEVLEHGVSDRVLAAIEKLLEFPTEDPHGHPIPDRHGRLPRRALVSLVSIPQGHRAVVREIRDRDQRRMTRWKQSGLVPGAEVRMREANLEDDVFEVEVAGRRIVAGSEGLDGILVERRRAGRP